MTRLGPRFLSRVGLLYGCLLTAGALIFGGVMAATSSPDLHPTPSGWRITGVVLLVGLIGVGQAVLRFGFRGAVECLRFTDGDSRSYVFAASIAFLLFGVLSMVDGWNDPEFWRNHWFETPRNHIARGPEWAQAIVLFGFGALGLWHSLTTPDDEDDVATAGTTAGSGEPTSPA